MKKVAIILSGCGVYDGSEIHEATMTMLAVLKNGGKYDLFAPDIDQHHVINHLTGEEMNEKRNVLVESARIARGQLSPLDQFNPVNYDALILPGGFGAAKNFSSYAFQGKDMVVNDEVKKAIAGMYAAGKPIGALCISPVIIANVIEGASVTIGQDETTSRDIEAMKGKHQEAGYTEVVIDEKNKVFTTPCYMMDANILQIAEGAENVVQAIFKSLG